MLSQRTLHFGNQLYWECACLRASESFPSGSRYHLNVTAAAVPDSSFVQSLKYELRQPQGQGPEQNPKSLHEMWAAIIPFYTRTNLTKPSDRLIALAGVTNKLARRYNLPSTSYNAGIWFPPLLEQLTWALKYDFVWNDWTSRPPSCKQFPSWSWACSEDEIVFLDLRYNTASRACFIYVVAVRNFRPFGPDGETRTYSTSRNDNPFE